MDFPAYPNQASIAAATGLQGNISQVFMNEP